jgi:hypothetical protein
MDKRKMNLSMDLRPLCAMDRNASARRLNAIVLCENSMVAFQNAPHLPTRFGENPRTWTFAALSVPTTRAAALQTAREAGVILVTAQGDSNLPSTVRSFLRQAVTAQPELPKPIALLTVSSAEGPSSASNVGRDLRRLATSTGTEFFEIAPRQSPAADISGNGLARAEVGQSPTPPPRRHWGINE